MTWRPGRVLARALVVALGILLFAVTFAASLVVFSILVAVASVVLGVALWRIRSMRARAQRARAATPGSVPRPPRRFPRR
jgi:type IV secretory pathway protease TraF